MPPVSASQATAQPTPVAILSLSDVRMKNGTAILPPVNESATANVQGALAPGRVQNPSPPGSGNPSAKSGQTGAGQASAKGNGANPATAANPNGSGAGPATAANPNASGAGPAKAAAKPNASGPGPASAAAKPSASGFGSGGDRASDTPDQPASTPIALPRDGHFSAVIVGEALEDQFPEVASVWGGRLAYTAYLHVGLAKSWILQYSLPRSADASAGGTIARLDAPWPYSIVRPNLAPGSVDADVLMIHGFVNQSGRFQALSVVFPPAFPRAQFVLDALQQWQFRPAMQDGQSVNVEVLLMIPQDLD